MSTATLDRTNTLAEWQDTARNLLSQMADWAAPEQGWSVEWYEVDREESKLGRYKSPAIRIHTPDGDLRCEPIARVIYGRRGTVELSAYPTLYRVRLIRPVKSNEWVIMTDSGIPIRQPWNRDTFVQVASDLVHAN